MLRPSTAWIPLASINELAHDGRPFRVQVCLTAVIFAAASLPIAIVEL